MWGPGSWPNWAWQNSRSAVRSSGVASLGLCAFLFQMVNRDDVTAASLSLLPSANTPHHQSVLGFRADLLRV